MSEMQLGVHSFIELLETIADNKYMLGDRLVEIGVSGPNLEATLAAVAMAQGELGHARLLYNWCFDLRGVKGKKAEIRGQTGKAFRGVVNVHNWISLIAALYTVNTAIHIVLQSTLESSHSKVASRIQKLIREQKDHIIYAKNWAKQLRHDQGAVPHRFRESLNGIIDEVYAWLAKVEQNQKLQTEGYLPKNVKLTEKFKEQLKEFNTEHLVHMK
ncbi:phenylacetate-CoA oxygenase subunit PaaI [Parageobacillus sp. VR-IP]|nr:MULTISPECIES: Phenylacetic acid catabolic protein [Parageobacillus]NUK32172.1 phenylacetate-CoA oxygenase subunit PaaI [Parageobacillus sp. VR-IP]QNU39602.1 phenylacetate-CoA oxygenase subunit PaaI [Geobacillus sp. 44B]BDG36301.1 phenylacetate-CoA oxygenase subunit PaaI [Parageobacillus caldoxylosilyticus]BDG40086.1 phenylacetate-CoA oxygenase subunit PaaI [Parageobacillus caldoxylosilyticus]